MRHLLKAGLLAALLGSGAGATNLEFGVGWPQAAQVGFSEWRAAGGTVAGTLSLRGAGLSYARGLALPPLGTVNAEARAEVGWSGGYRLSARASGAAGPLALSLAASVSTVAAPTLDPLAAWLPHDWNRPPSSYAPGWNAEAGLRYRLRRDLVAVAGGELGGQNSGYVGLEYRRTLTRPLPPGAEEGGDDPAAPATGEEVGNLTWRAGARGGQNVLAATAGVSYSRADGKTLSLDAQLGRGGPGIIASASVPEALGEGSSLRAYAAYEPWRQSAAPLRLGLETSRPLGRGTLRLDVRGGQDHAGQTGWGASLGYTLPLGTGTP